jgi:hypothetical protein
MRPRNGLLRDWEPGSSHIPSITTSALARHTSSWTCLEVVSFSPEFFSATKVRARIVRWNRRGSTGHRCDPNPGQDHDYLFKLPRPLLKALSLSAEYDI